MADDLAAISAGQGPLIGHYRLLRTIGQGSFGKVWLGRHLPTGTEVAVKAIPRQGVSTPQSRLLREVDGMALLRHPHVVRLYEVIRTQNSWFLIMEHVSGGDLWDHLDARGALTETEARRIFRQLLSAVHYCHQRGIVHRDLKPTNVLLDAAGNVKLADFGLSAPFQHTKLRTFCGNAAYAAPELFWAREYDGPPVDAWSLGVLLFRMVAGVVPFKGKDLRETGLKILGGRYEVPAHFSSGLRLLLARLLAQDPGARSTVGGVMTDPWVTEGQEEERGPPSEPPPGDDDVDLDPWVTQEMAKLGIPSDRIEHALMFKTYSDIMGTYLILSTQKPPVRVRTIRVRPFRSPDAGSRSPSPAQEARAQSSGLQPAEPPPQDREAGQKAPESAGPAASPEPSPATPGPSPPPAAATPAPSPPSATPGPGPRSALATPGPGPGPLSAIASRGPSLQSLFASLQSLFAAPGPSLQSVMAAPGPSPKPPAPSPRPSRKSTTAKKPKPSPKWRKVAPRHSPKARNPTPRPSPKTRTATPSPSPSPSPQRRTATPPPLQESELSSASPPPTPESRKATPSPAPQGGPAHSPCSPGASGSSSGTGTGTAEGASQGRRGVARRCLDFLKKLCLRPCKKGRGKRNRVAPL